MKIEVSRVFTDNSFSDKLLISTYRNDKRSPDHHTIEIPLTKVSVKHKDMWFLVSDELEIVDDFFEYLNFIKFDTHDEIRANIAIVLRELYLYARLFEVDYKNMDTSDANGLISFLAFERTTIKGIFLYHINRFTKEDVRNYLYFIQDFLKEMNYKHKAIDRVFNAYLSNIDTLDLPL